MEDPMVDEREELRWWFQHLVESHNKEMPIS